MLLYSIVLNKTVTHLTFKYMLAGYFRPLKFSSLLGGREFSLYKVRNISGYNGNLYLR